MAFNSYHFVLFFLPIVLIGYYALGKIPGKMFGKLFLGIASAFFYAYAGIGYLIFIGISMLFNWLCLWLMEVRNRRFAKPVMLFGVCADALFLVLCKYGNFFLSEINRLFSVRFSELHLMIPLGLSFLTFNQISFLVDGYREEFKWEGVRFEEYFLYVMFFPKIVSGPLMGFAGFSLQLRDENRKKICWDRFAHGMETFILGMGKKVLLADRLGGIVNYGFANTDCMNMANSLIVMLCFTFEIYFDFSAYSDMAIGIAEMMNFELPMNFDSPYRAVNMKEFWDRWHISLTKFLTKYIYIPLGGSRKGKARTYLNIFAVFIVSGI